MKQSSVMVYILVAVIDLFLQACSHSSSYEEEVLDCAAKMMEEYPDSALRILREIPLHPLEPTVYGQNIRS